MVNGKAPQLEGKLQKGKKNVKKKVKRIGNLQVNRDISTFSKERENSDSKENDRFEKSSRFPKTAEQ